MRKSFYRFVMLALSFVLLTQYFLSTYAVVDGFLSSESAIFFKKFIMNPLSVGSLVPSSSFLANQMAQVIDHAQRSGEKDSSQRYLEVGAGTGACTQAIVSRLRDRDHLDIIEIDRALANIVRKRYENDSRITVACCDIREWAPAQQYHALISSIPFNGLPDEVGVAIVKQYEKILCPGGCLSFFSYLRPWNSKTAVRTLQKRKYADHTVYMNLPPARVFFVTLS